MVFQFFKRLFFLILDLQIESCQKVYDIEFLRIFLVFILFLYRRLKKILIGLCYFCVIKISNLLILRDYRYNCLYFIGIFEVYVKVVLINFIFIVICKLFLN